MKAVDVLQRILLPRKGEPHDVRMLYLIESEQNTKRASWPDRTRVTVPEGAEVSFQTYFNAFPASYWRRWSQLDTVVLAMDVEGAATISVYRSKHDGVRIAVTNVEAQDERVEIPLKLANFEDGGWLWFDINAESDATIANCLLYTSDAADE